jgi:hypothetical protein
MAFTVIKGRGLDFNLKMLSGIVRRATKLDVMIIMIYSLK